jgi:hypothetical protein
VGRAKNDRNRVPEALSRARTVRDLDIQGNVTDQQYRETPPLVVGGGGSGDANVFAGVVAAAANPTQMVSLVGGGSYQNYTGRFLLAGDEVLIAEGLTASGVVGLKRDGVVLYPPNLPPLGGYALLNAMPYPFITDVFSPASAIRDASNVLGFGTDTFWSQEVRHTIGDSVGVTEGNQLVNVPGTEEWGMNFTDTGFLYHQSLGTGTNSTGNTPRYRDGSGNWGTAPTVTIPSGQTSTFAAGRDTNDLFPRKRIQRVASFPEVKVKHCKMLHTTTSTGNTAPMGLYVQDGSTLARIDSGFTLTTSTNPIVVYSGSRAWVCESSNSGTTPTIVRRCYNTNTGALVASPNFTLPAWASTFWVRGKNPVGVPTPDGSLLVLHAAGSNAHTAYVFRTNGTVDTYPLSGFFDIPGNGSNAISLEVVCALSDNTWVAMVHYAGNSTSNPIFQHSVVYLTDGGTWVPIYQSTASNNDFLNTTHAPALRRNRIHNDGSGLWSWVEPATGTTFYYEATWPYAAPHY